MSPGTLVTVGVRICICNMQSRGSLNKNLINTFRHKFRETLGRTGSGESNAAAQETGVVGSKGNVTVSLSCDEFIFTH